MDRHATLAFATVVVATCGGARAADFVEARCARDYATAVAVAEGNADAETLADLRALAATKTRILEGAKRSSPQAVYMEMGGRARRGHLKAADGNGFSVDFGGVAKRFSWRDISDARFYHFARAFCDERSSADHLTLARACMVLMLVREAADELAAAGSGAEADALRRRHAELIDDAVPDAPAAASADRAAPRAVPAADDRFVDAWVHAGLTSATIYWRMDDMSREATSYVEYGPTDAYGRRTSATDAARWSHLHRITGLKTGAVCHYRMVLVEGTREVRSSDRSLVTRVPTGAVVVGASAKTVVLDRKGATYVLAGDVTSSGTGIEIVAPDVTLDLDGHVVTFTQGGTKRSHGILVSAPRARVLNGRVVQGAPGGPTSYALASFGSRSAGLVAAGLDLYVHAHAGYPIALINGAADVEVRHNRCASDTVTLKSRHYPGNDLVRIDAAGAASVHHNILERGCHRGMSFMRPGKHSGTVEVSYNEIAHDQGYVNGYAINSCNDMNAHHNRVVSCARGMHVTASNVEVHDNWFDTTQHQVYDDRPQGSTTYRHYYTENHGIKLESPGVNVKIFRNTVTSTQPQPEADAPQRFSTGIKTIPGVRIEEVSRMTGDRDHYAPATPLNFHSKKRSDVEVYENTFVAITTYRASHLGHGYGCSGEFAAALRAAGPFAGSLYIHDNVFKSNDMFARCEQASPGVRIERNRFVLLPNATSNHRACVGDGVAEALRRGGNTFEGQRP